jgi:hypothetical protein
VATSTISLQLNTSYQQTALTTGPIQAANATNKAAIQTPPSVQVQEHLEPPSHTGTPVGAPGASVKGASLNYSGDVNLGPAPTVKG